MKTFIVTINTSAQCNVGPETLKDLIQSKYEVVEINRLPEGVSHKAVVSSLENVGLFNDEPEDFFSKHRELVQHENEEMTKQVELKEELLKKHKPSDSQLTRWDNEGGGHPHNPENR